MAIAKFQLIVPAGVRVGRLVFPPRRAKLSAVSVAGGSGRVLAPLLAKVQFPEAAASSWRVTITYTYEGEPPGRPAVYWKRGALEILDVIISTDWPQLYVAREAYSALDREHALLFELDRQTNPSLVALVGDLPQDQKDWRLKIWDFDDPGSLINVLLGRLKGRMTGQSKLPLPSREDTRLVSGLIWQVFRRSPLGRRRATLGRTLERFAAGQLRRVICVFREEGRIPVMVCEPDSFFVFFFAEFATVAISAGCERGRWEELLPHLLVMQRAYTRRFRVKGPLLLYGEPARALSEPQLEQVRQQVRKSFRGRTVDEIIRANIQDAES